MSDVVKENRKNDIIFKLKAREGATTNLGVIDKNLFTGDNNLHAVLDKQTMLWNLKYEKGILPQPLQQRFTGLHPLMKTIKDYFDKRNIDIIEIID